MTHTFWSTHSDTYTQTKVPMHEGRSSKKKNPESFIDCVKNKSQIGNLHCTTIFIFIIIYLQSLSYLREKKHTEPCSALSVVKSTTIYGKIYFSVSSVAIFCIPYCHSAV